MGDYVEREPAMQRQGTLDALFDVPREEVLSAPSRKFSFLVDSELLGNFREEIERVAEV
jgi:hypothetical protein